uniref:Uncharacterized protein n=1 Tax=Tanacetum cinerariifolium TaxID=118510 RepID=A0A699J931_TANCI|nr:hypothetical protein [Tanacetum cinerariifolium]
MRLGLDDGGGDDEWEDGEQFFPEMVDAMNKVYLIPSASVGESTIFYYKRLCPIALSAFTHGHMFAVLQLDVVNVSSGS